LLKGLIHRSPKEARSVDRLRRGRLRSVAVVAAGLAFASTLTAGLSLGAAGVASAAVPTPLYSTSTNTLPSSGSLTAGTVLQVNFNEPPVLASAYSLTLTDGTNTGTLSTADGSLAASVSGDSIVYTVTKNPVLNGFNPVSLSNMEILSETGVTDGAGNPWNLAASGEVDKYYLLGSNDQIQVVFNEVVTVGSTWSLSLANSVGSNTGSISNTDATVAGSGTTTLTFTLTGAPHLNGGSSSLAADGVKVTGATGFSGPAPTTIVSGDTLTATSTQHLSLAFSYGVTLSDGTNSATLTSASGLSSGQANWNGIHTTLTYNVTTTPSTSVSTAGTVNITAQTGLSVVPPGTVTLPLAVTVTPPAGAAPTIVSYEPLDGGAPTCTQISAHTRFFNAANGNCSIGFGDNSQPTSPDVYDVIPYPTADLPGPPNDNAPEVITNCQATSTDTVYDVNTSAVLGTNACGNNPPGEVSIGNTNSDTLNYIPTPNIANFEEIGVVETLPGSTYVSATAVPPQLENISVSGSQALFTYYNNVSCQSTTSPNTLAQFSYETPYTNLNAVDKQYPSTVACPSGNDGNTILATFASAIPSNVRFKFEGYGPDFFIVGAADSPFANEREASESGYVGPEAAVTSFTPASTSLASGGGTVNIAYTTSGAQSCTLSATSLPSSAPGLTLPAASTCPGSGSVTVPANTSTTSNNQYTLTLTAQGVSGTPASSAEITITVAAAPAPSTPTSSGGGSSSSSSSSSSTTTPTTVAPVILPAKGHLLLPVLHALAPNHAPLAGGVWVTIKGTGFTKHVVVRFGKKVAKKVRYISSTKLLALAPAGKGFVTVTVHTAYGTSKVLRFHYVAVVKAHKG